MRTKIRVAILLLALTVICGFWFTEERLRFGKRIGKILPGKWSGSDAAEKNKTNDSGESIDEPDTNSSIHMLVWTKWWWPVHEGLLTECPRTNCYLTAKKTQLLHSDVVVFHSRTLDWTDMPKERFVNQSYVFANWEPPYRTGGGFTEDWKREYFNMTMTYRRDSDAYAPYGAIVKRRTPLRLNLKKLAANKSKPVAWMVGNCNTPGGREVLVDNLKNYINIDIYGHCGNYSCVRDNREFNNPKTCGSIFEQNYKFYLSFENHMCQDYISEKFFLRLQRYVVPVVLERRNFGHFIPEYGTPWFIAVDDFKSVKELGEYLQYLNSNMTAYYKYLEWHQYYETVVYLNSDTGTLTNNHWCALCEATARRKKNKKKLNIVNWWWNNACDSTNKLFHDFIWLCKFC